LPLIRFSKFMSTKTKLVLFDIDGTLLTSGGAGERALRLVLKDRFGCDDDLANVEIAGKTDSAIARRIFEQHGIEPSAENLGAFYDGYLDHLAAELPKTKGRLLPGILKLLEALKAKPQVAIALLTGNLSRGANLKLTHYGVWHYFEFGAFADDHHDRNRLGSFARARAREKLGVEFAPDQIFVLGDTPHDIDCGRAIGAKTVAIATGGATRDQLAAHKPDFLFDDLSDVQAVITALGL
jgi:phosphoglycolate phosphatase-like HAD superfamily hydrolase